MVSFQDGAEQPGLFHRLQQDQHSNIEGKLLALPFGLIQESRQNGYSAGSYFAVEGSGGSGGIGRGGRLFRLGEYRPTIAAHRSSMHIFNIQTQQPHSTP